MGERLVESGGGSGSAGGGDQDDIVMAPLTTVYYRISGSTHLNQIIASGGTNGGVNEAFVMRDYLIARGVPRGSIIVDSHGDTTYASARNAACILRERNGTGIFVVTQYFHVPRTRLALERCGVTPVFSAHAHWFELRDLYSAPRELLAYIYYYYRSY